MHAFHAFHALIPCRFVICYGKSFTISVRLPLSQDVINASDELPSRCGTRSEDGTSHVVCPGTDAYYAVHVPYTTMAEW